MKRVAEYKKSEETKEKILDAASKLFFEKGYGETTIKDIANLSKLSLSRMNYHFDNKAELAGLICRMFLKSLSDEIRAIIKTFTSDVILRDTIHIAFWAKIFMNNSNCRNFYYELACDDILRHNLVESSVRHFIDQLNYLHIDYEKENARAQARVFVASLIELIIATKEGDLTMPVQQIIDTYNDFHLRLLDYDKTKMKGIIEEANLHVSHIRYEINDLMSIRLWYSNEPEPEEPDKNNDFNNDDFIYALPPA